MTDKQRPDMPVMFILESVAQGKFTPEAAAALLQNIERQKRSRHDVLMWCWLGALTVGVILVKLYGAP